jgi:hypothetical protein
LGWNGGGTGGEKNFSDGWLLRFSCSSSAFVFSIFV